MGKKKHSDNSTGVDDDLSKAERAYHATMSRASGSGAGTTAGFDWEGSSGGHAGGHGSSWANVCSHNPKAVKCGDTQIYASGRRYLTIPEGLREFDFAIPLGAEFNLATFIGYTGFLLPFPIKDFSAPAPHLLKITAERMLAFARKGNKVITFCEGSHGRTGLVLATCIGLAEPDCDDPVEAARKRHCKKACETNAQIVAVFKAIGKPVPAKYATSGGSKESWRSFTTSQLEGLDDALDVPRIAPKDLTTGVVVSSSSAALPPPAKAVVGQCICPQNSPLISGRCPVHGQGKKEGTAKGAVPFAFAADWPSNQRMRLLNPLVEAVSKFQKAHGQLPTLLLHPVHGLRCQVCLHYEKDPTRLTVSPVLKRMIPHHLDCDEVNTKVAILSDEMIEDLRTKRPELWRIYRDKRKHRRKRHKRKERQARAKSGLN